MIDYLELAAGGTARELYEQRRQADAAAGAAQPASQSAARENELLTRLNTVQEQISALDRRAIRPAEIAQPARRAPQLGGAVSGDEMGSARLMTAVSPEQAGGADWVGRFEQTLRRDSRRYDAGFFLY